jgi:dipeptidyl-peptidase-4
VIRKALTTVCLALLTALSGCGGSDTVQPPATAKVTARMLVQPNALMGSGPSAFAWSPAGAVLAFVDPVDGRDVLWSYDASTDKRQMLFDPGANTDGISLASVQWSSQGDRLLMSGADALWLLDPASATLKALARGGSAKTSVMFSPDGTRIAYVQDNDLYLVRISDGGITRLTTDGSSTVFNGTLDWVYDEELATRSAQPAYAWSPDSQRLIHLRLDEAGVQNHPVTDYRTTPPTVGYTRYPTAGSANPKATVRMINVETGARNEVGLGDDAEYVMPFFSWFADSREALFVTVNRAHTTLRLMAWNPATNTGRTVITETDPYWVNENAYTAPILLGNDSQFLWLSERDGYMHLYLYKRDGSMVRQVTSGAWMIDSPAWNVLVPGRPVFVDPEGEYAYFSGTKNGPLQRQVYRVDIAGSGLERVSPQDGFHFGALSGDGRYLVDQSSDVATPPATWIVRSDGTRVKLLGQRAGPAIALPRVSREFVTIKAHDGTDLYAQIVKPENFDLSRKYPVIVHWYGGPTLQLVSNRYGATNLFNHIERDVLYTQEGFIVWRLDNRGSFGRGHGFETPIYKELGKAALDDQLAGVEYLRTLPYVNADWIGVDGKSFGGFLTLYALIHVPDVFKAGVACSGPTDWSLYDTIYTERYMQTPSANPAGYAATSLVAAAGQIRVAPQLIHGLVDTNVHLENTVNFIQALEKNDRPFYFTPLPNTNHRYSGDGPATALEASVTYFVSGHK